jgi:hypothetical protein
MGRIVGQTDTPAKRRNAHLRSCAEVVRLLAQQRELGPEGRDMTAFLVFSLRGVWQTIDESAQVWDERDYWKKAEALRHKWRWTRAEADEIARILRTDDLAALPLRLIEVAGRLQSVTVTQITRDSDWWVGAYRALMREQVAA